MAVMQTRLRAKPGSVLADGSVIDDMGIPSSCGRHLGPIWVPDDFGVSLRRIIARCHALERAGWVSIPPRHPLYPGIPPRRGLMCIAHRDHPVLRRQRQLQGRV